MNNTKQLLAILIVSLAVVLAKADYIASNGTVTSAESGGPLGALWGITQAAQIGDSVQGFVEFERQAGEYDVEYLDYGRLWRCWGTTGNNLTTLMVGISTLSMPQEHSDMTPTLALNPANGRPVVAGSTYCRLGPVLQRHDHQLDLHRA